MATSYALNGIIVESGNILTNDAQSGSNNTGTSIQLTSGTGDGTGNGGDIVFTAGAGGGSGTQGSITFSALDSTTPLPLNEIGDVDLIPAFTATSIVGALNELKGAITNDNVQQQLYTSTTDLNYNGTTEQDVPDAQVEISAGDWLVNMSVVFTTSDPTEPVIIYVKETAGNTIIEESKTFIADASSNSRHLVTKQFVYTEALASNTLKISYLLNAGAATSVAIEMVPMSGSSDPDQIPLLVANQVETSFQQGAYTTLTDLNYNGTTEVDVTDATVTLTAGTYLIGYSVTLRVPTSPDDILVYVEDAGGTLITESQTYLADNNTACRHTVSKAFIFTASATSYQLKFRLRSTATVSTAVEMTALPGTPDPDQVPVLWAYELTGLTTDQATYSAADIAYNGTTTVDIPATSITLDSGVWLFGYSMALNAPSTPDSSLIHVRNSADDIVSLSKTFVTENATSSRHTVSRCFVLSQVSDSETYKMSFRLNTSAAVNTAVDMTTAGQEPVIWAVKVGESPTSNEFLTLNDTPESYIGQMGKYVAVNQSETGLSFIEPIYTVTNSPSIPINSVNTNITGTPATTGVTVLKSVLVNVGGELTLTAVFSINTIAAGTTSFVCTIPQAATFTNIYDITAPLSAWVETSPETSLTDALCVGIAATTTATISFTALNGTDTHYVQINARYTSS